MAEQSTDALRDIYNLILNKGTRDWERQKLQQAKTEIETGAAIPATLERLEAVLRPLASRNNLTPAMTDFYARLTNDPLGDMAFDFTRHEAADLPHEDRAIFGGGCFWCMVEPFETMPGIVSVLSGYTGGHTAEPTYDQVLTQTTGHVEGVEIIFDTRVVTYAQLVALYWQLTDPTDAGGQFEDRGNEYRPVIFVRDAVQRKIAEQSKQALIASGKYRRPIVTAIEAASTFWPAENFHQQFYKKQPKRYRQIEKARQQYLTWQNLQGRLRRAR
ncbi:peptide-methionine (S)-S-oxide reductase MsrA [Schleiferilactobacillus harbinensis]|uniref:Peptide methionine sulfoxide reductase MsrA n=1 Tax=Schleiferilactobacillus harbinensis DSM 16991 TaxID=1122147 RepID=A0A0R1XI53_9LACO|nr:peptide-methionine (S)-S-oxide reductase MsrA [Schleiferilactobacillus harbinensis]KRM29895.1 peptide methionine sulfoxide reductase [Schleiferilactobacillus harbinensis DSM 16991]QFR63123.1 peptide-methionine (S)-S-oxide reductase MsrA [Schleiferilactobacillus harbinensis]